MSLESYYSKLAQHITQMIREDWEEIRILVEDDGIKTIFFYYLPQKTDSWVSDSEIPELFLIDEEEHEQLEDELSFCVSDFKKAFQKETGEEWTSFQMIISKDGKFNIAYNYDKNPFGPVVTRIAWEYEHLGYKQEGDPFYEKLLKEYLDLKARGNSYSFLMPIELD